MLQISSLQLEQLDLYLNSVSNSVSNTPTLSQILQLEYTPTLSQTLQLEHTPTLSQTLQLEYTPTRIHSNSISNFVSNPQTLSLTLKLFSKLSKNYCHQMSLKTH